MNMTLREINELNWKECILLTTHQENKHFVFEEFIASNALSIAQSKVERDWIIKAIYVEQTMIGFTMYGYAHEHQFYELCRLMIDHTYQGNGYGKIALKLVIDEMKQLINCHEIYLSFHPNNKRAKHLYETLNFKDTGKYIDGEVLYCLKLNS